MSQPRTVVVVDDSATVAKQLTKIFEDSGRYRVLGHAADGLQALKMVRELSPDFVCLDVVMPNLDGVAALRMMRQFNRNTQVVIISSLGGLEEMMKEFLEAGAKSVLSKPLDGEKVLNTLDAL
ncbi:MAG TPA: response regulator [bacterium]|nr:response regulator [bacterium]